MSTYIRSLVFAAAFTTIAAAQPAVTGLLNTVSHTLPGFPNAGLAQGGI